MDACFHGASEVQTFSMTLHYLCKTQKCDSPTDPVRRGCLIPFAI